MQSNQAQNAVARLSAALGPQPYIERWTFSIVIGAVTASALTVLRFVL